MDAITPLVLMWLATRARAKGGASASKAPAWPTPASPPPMPAFKAKPTPRADTATPLSALHASPPTPPPAGPHATTPKAAPKPPSAARVVPGVLTSTLPVKRLQQALNARGARLVPDGLYGPKTAAAWRSLASSKGLTPTIVRKAPTLADVATHTFDALSVPAIP